MTDPTERSPSVKAVMTMADAIHVFGGVMASGMRGGKSMASLLLFRDALAPRHPSLPARFVPLPSVVVTRAKPSHKRNGREEAAERQRMAAEARARMATSLLSGNADPQGRGSPKRLRPQVGNSRYGRFG